MFGVLSVRFCLKISCLSSRIQLIYYLQIVYDFLELPFPRNIKYQTEKVLNFEYKDFFLENIHIFDDADFLLCHNQYEHLKN